ncbi:hypothetical protein EAS62_38700 [Bradyrhizobium zhanjiangense]|uniref:Uncharacterized protein n=1 Tax=Bradyrhizobium zhanjiangense TaxID=1325107 RepID=A0ABY0D8P8_9BRAD|nr:hypothetical protein EAS62_38700 [Bradyrhizobium zhanjiangense]
MTESSLPEPHMEHGVSRQKHLFVRLGAHLFVPTASPLGWRAQIKSRPACWAAAKRLGLDLIEHAIRLPWLGISGPVLQQQADSD